jgi:hypothetical protein
MWAQRIAARAKVVGRASLGSEVGQGHEMCDMTRRVSMHAGSFMLEKWSNFGVCSVIWEWRLSSSFACLFVLHISQSTLLLLVFCLFTYRYPTEPEAACDVFMVRVFLLRMIQMSSRDRESS